MKVIDGILLGILQGFTEFLPISSSGHLVLLQELLNIKNPGVLVEVSLHLGTLFSIIIYFWNDVINILIEFVNIIKNKGRLHKTGLQENEYSILIKMVIIGSIPTALMGIFFEPLFKKAYENLIMVGIMLLITGLLLWLGNKLSGIKTVKDITTLDSIFVGIFQGLAISPGLSRSGATIFACLFRGIDKESAVKFSFILSLPAVLGAFLFELKDILKMGLENINLLACFLGLISATITGYFAIKLLFKLLISDKLHYFSYYCWILGFSIIFLAII